LRKRIFLATYPHAGRKLTTEIYESYFQVKWAYGSAPELEDRQYQDADGNTITLEAGETRWDTNGTDPWMGDDRSDPRPPGFVTFYDGDFYLPDGRYIPAILFTNNDTSDQGILNSGSLIRPINPDTGEFNEARFSQVPNYNRYYTFDKNANTKIYDRLKKIQFPETDSDYYNIAISAHRYFPRDTDPKEASSYPIYCVDNKYYVWVYKGKVEKFKTDITNIDAQGPIGDFSINYGTLGNGVKIGYVPWPRQTTYTKMEGSHPPTKSGEDGFVEAPDQPYTDSKFNDSYQSAIERVVELGNWAWDVENDTDYQTNWLRNNNYFDTVNNRWLYETEKGVWLSNKYAAQDNMALLKDENWGCNGAAIELLLKNLGEEAYDWYWDTETPKKLHAMEKMKEKDSHLVHQPDNLNILYPDPIGCWRRTWKNTFGRKPDTKYWPSELGTPPNYQIDNRMIITQEQYDAADFNFKEKWYRTITSIEQFNDDYYAAYGEYLNPSDFGQYGDELDVENNAEGVQFILDNFTPGTETAIDTDYDDSTQLPAEYFIVKNHHPVQIIYTEIKNENDEITGYKNHGQYELKTQLLIDMRSVLLQLRYHKVHMGVGVGLGYAGGYTLWEGDGSLGAGTPPKKTYEEAYQAAIKFIEAIELDPPTTTAQYLANPDAFRVDLGRRSGESSWILASELIKGMSGEWGYYNGQSYIAFYNMRAMVLDGIPGFSEDFYVVDVIQRSHCIIIPSSDLIPVGATMYLRIKYIKTGGATDGKELIAFGKNFRGTDEYKYIYLKVGIPQGQDNEWHLVEDTDNWAGSDVNAGTGTTCYYSTTNNWFYSTDWDYIPESVWVRDVWNNYEWESCDNPSTYVTSPEIWHPDLDTDNTDTPLWHLPPHLDSQGNNAE